MHPRVLAMYHSSFQPKESLLWMIIPCNQNSPCYVPSCLPKQKSPHKVSQGITLKESLLFLNHLFTRYELWKKMARTLFVELKCCRNSIPGGTILVSSNCFFVRMPCHILSRHTTIHQCGMIHVFFKGVLPENVLSHFSHLNKEDFWYLLPLYTKL